MYRRRGLSDREILLELEGDISGDDFSDSDEDEYELVASAVRAQVEEFIRGSFDFRTEIHNNIFAIKWFDNKPVHLVSSFLGPDPVNNVQRWSAEKRRYIEVPRPHVIAEYNQHMGGVDLNDMLVFLYRMDMGTKKYYFRIFYRLIDVCIVNAWLLYRKVMTKKNIKK